MAKYYYLISTFYVNIYILIDNYRKMMLELWNVPWIKTYYPWKAPYLSLSGKWWPTWVRKRHQSSNVSLMLIILMHALWRHCYTVLHGRICCCMPTRTTQPAYSVNFIVTLHSVWPSLITGELIRFPVGLFIILTLCRYLWAAFIFWMVLILFRALLIYVAISCRITVLYFNSV